MPYAAFTTPAGEAAGYTVAAACDAAGCDTEIHRGEDALCGPSPDGLRHADEEHLAGCGRWYCDQHLDDHACPRPACGVFGADPGVGSCHLVTGHDGPHDDGYGAFTETEEA